MKPAYFDLTVRDVGAARAFFEKVLGWRFERFPMPYEYYRIQAGPKCEPGIDGGTSCVKDAPLSDGKPMTQVTVPVADLDEALARIAQAGGSIVEPKTPIPGVGWYASCAEPGGLVFGVVQAGEIAQPPMRIEPEFIAATPVLASLDIERSADFFASKLGFTKVHVEQGVYGIVGHGSVQIHFWPCADARIAQATSCRVQVRGVRGLFERCVGERIVHPDAPLQSKPWGTAEFAVLDPDGNLVTFFEKIDVEASISPAACSGR